MYARYFFFLLLIPIAAFCQPVKSLKGSVPVIVLDAGHGGLDLGASSKTPSCEEKKIALTTALLAKKYLDKLGYRVILTRNSDIFISLSRRVKIAHPSRAILFVSLHYNFAANATAHGIEIFYCDSKQEGQRSSASKKLANTILKNVLRRTNAKSRGVKKGNFYVLRESKVPAVLLEGGFISNPEERGKLRQRQYIDKIARAVADGVDKYFRS